MDYHRKIIDLLEENLTEASFKLWRGIDKLIPNCWDKPTSTTGKYHKKANGDVQKQGEHIYEMLYATSKIIKLFGHEVPSAETDKIFLAVAMHDTMKFGQFGTRKHTDNRHDKLGADMVASNKRTFNKIFTDEQFFVLEESMRFHSGRWSTDAKWSDFNWKDYNPETLFIHILDMLSTQDLLKSEE